MFEGSIEARILHEVLDSVGVLVDEGQMEFTDERLEIGVKQPGNVASVEVGLSANAFETYDADPQAIGVSVDRLREVVDVADANQLVELEVEMRRFRLRTDGIEYTLRLIDSDVIGDRPSIDERKLTTQITLEGSVLEKLTQAVGTVGDTVTLGVDESDESFYASVEGDYDDVRFERGASEIENLELHSARSRYSVNYLRRISEAIPADAFVHIRFGDGTPAEIQYSFAKDHGCVTYNLAPVRKT